MIRETKSYHLGKAPGGSAQLFCQIFFLIGGETVTPPPFRSEGDLPPQLRTPIPITVTRQSRRFLAVVKSINMSIFISYPYFYCLAVQSVLLFTVCKMCAGYPKVIFPCGRCKSHKCVLWMRIVCVQRFISQSVRSFPLSATLGVCFFWFIVSGSIYDCWGGNAYVRDLNMGGRICSSFSLALARFLTLISLCLPLSFFLSLILSSVNVCGCVCVF